jgi:hypothetical protein
LRELTAKEPWEVLVLKATLNFRGRNKTLQPRAVEVLEDERPMTLRALYYRLISAGDLENRQQEYHRLKNLMTRLREAGHVPRTWIVDHLRCTLKPSSWTGLADFGDSVRDCYRRDFWSSMGAHVEIFVEKDAIAGTIQPVTERYDVALRVCRGYSSISFAGEIADLWARIKKPVHAYYLGDFDPSGFDLERDLREKLQRYSKRFDYFLLYDRDGSCRPADPPAKQDHTYWHRLAVKAEDFAEFDLVCLPVKKTDRRAAGFIEAHGNACAELDALPPTELRRRVEEAIESHIDRARWERLRLVEQAERQTLAGVVAGWGENGKLT